MGKDTGIDDDMRAGLTLADLESSGQPMTDPKAPKPLGWTEPDRAWLTEKPPARRFLVKYRHPGHGGNAPETPVGFLPMGEVCMLAAAGASGKTFLAISLALAVAGCRERWLDGNGAPSPLVMAREPGRVALVLAEDRADEIRRRIQAQTDLDGIDPKAIMGRIVILPREGMPEGDPALVCENPPKSGSYVASPFGVQLRAELEARAGADGWALVVLDPLSAFGGPAAETDNAAATAVIREIERLTELPGAPAVLLTHHTRKLKTDDKGKEKPMDVDDIRGASGLVNRVRWAMMGRPKGETAGGGARITEWSVVKFNYGPPMPDMLVAQARYASGAVRVALPGEKVVSADDGKADKPVSTPVKARSGAV